MYTANKKIKKKKKIKNKKSEDKVVSLKKSMNNDNEKRKDERKLNNDNEKRKDERKLNNDNEKKKDERKLNNDNEKKKDERKLNKKEITNTALSQEKHIQISSIISKYLSSQEFNGNQMQKHYPIPNYVSCDNFTLKPTQMNKTISRIVFRQEIISELILHAVTKCSSLGPYIFRHAAWVGPPALCLQTLAWMYYIDNKVWDIFRVLLTKLKNKSHLQYWHRPQNIETNYNMEAHSEMATEIENLICPIFSVCNCFDFFAL